MSTALGTGPGRPEVRAADADAERLGRLIVSLDEDGQLGQPRPRDAGDHPIVDLNPAEALDAGRRLSEIAEHDSDHQFALDGQGDPASVRRHGQVVDVAPGQQLRSRYLGHRTVRRCDDDPRSARNLVDRPHQAGPIPRQRSQVGSSDEHSDLRCVVERRPEHLRPVGVDDGSAAGPRIDGHGPCFGELTERSGDGSELVTDDDTGVGEREQIPPRGRFGSSSPKDSAGPAVDAASVSGTPSARTTTCWIPSTWSSVHASCAVICSR